MEAIRSNLVRQSSAILPAASPILTLSRSLQGSFACSHCAASNGFDGDALRAGRPQVGQFDGRWYGPEPVCYVAEASGSYRLEIRPLNQTATRGAYQLKVEELRAPTPQDRARVVAIKVSTEGKRLIEQGGAQSVQTRERKKRKGAAQWREIGDRFAEGRTLDNIGFLLWRLGAPAKTIEYYNQALTIRQGSKTRRERARNS